MSSTSKSNRRKPKQQWQVKQPTRNWLDLPSDIMANILHRVSVSDILENAQKVCTAWRKICKEPAMWRVVCMDYFPITNFYARVRLREMCKHVVDRSQGQLVDFTIVDLYDDELLLYIADRSSQLRRLEIGCCYGYMKRNWTEALKKFSFLEELSLYSTEISKEAIKTVGYCCPMLKTLKVNRGESFEVWDDDEESIMIRNEIALAIGENLHELRHLELIGNLMTNIGLHAILVGCRHLESLDLRQCFYIDLKGGDLGKRCTQQIEFLKLPYDSLEGVPYIYENDDFDDSNDDSDDSNDEYHGYCDYDVFTAPHHDFISWLL